MSITNTVAASAEIFDDVLKAIPFGFLGAATFADIHRPLLSWLYPNDVERIMRELVEASRIVPYYIHGAATRWYRPIAVGMGATYTSGSDRHACTVTAISSGYHTLSVRTDRATRTDANGMSESQDYTYSPDPDGALYVYRWSAAQGIYQRRGSRLILGVRRNYHDYSF